MCYGKNNIVDILNYPIGYRKKVHHLNKVQINMKKPLIILSLILIAACAPSQDEKRQVELELAKEKANRVAAVTCSIMVETLNMDAAVRVEKMNDAREKIGGDPFLSGDSLIKEALGYGLCQELVLNESFYEKLQLIKDFERERQRILAKEEQERQRIAAEEYEAEKLRRLRKYEVERNRQEELRKKEEIVTKFKAIIEGNLYLAWVIPSSFRNGMEAGIQIQFTQSGKVEDIEILQPSGNNDFDKSIEILESMVEMSEIRLIPVKIFDEHFRQFDLVFAPPKQKFNVCKRNIDGSTVIFTAYVCPDGSEKAS